MGPWVVLALGATALFMIVVTVLAVIPTAVEISPFVVVALTLALAMGFIALAALAGLGIEIWWNQLRGAGHRRR